MERLRRFFIDNVELVRDVKEGESCPDIDTVVYSHLYRAMHFHPNPVILEYDIDDSGVGYNLADFVSVKSSEFDFNNFCCIKPVNDDSGKFAFVNPYPVYSDQDMQATVEEGIADVILVNKSSAYSMPDIYDDLKRLLKPNGIIVTVCTWLHDCVDYLPDCDEWYVDHESGLIIDHDSYQLVDKLIYAESVFFDFSKGDPFDWCEFYSPECLHWLILQNILYQIRSGRVQQYKKVEVSWGMTINTYVVR